MTHATCRLTAKNRDKLRNPTLGNRVWATFFIWRKLIYPINLVKALPSERRWHTLSVAKFSSHTASEQLRKTLLWGRFQHQCIQLSNTNKLKKSAFVTSLLPSTRASDEQSWIKVHAPVRVFQVRSLYVHLAIRYFTSFRVAEDASGDNLSARREQLR